MKPHSFVFTFSNDGKWALVVNKTNSQTTDRGTYQIRDSELILTKDDGSAYQDWQVQLGDDGKSLKLSDPTVSETFSRIKH